MWCPYEGQVMEIYQWGGWGGWTAPSGPTYMLAGTHGACIYCRAVGWTAPSRPTYMSAGMLGALIYFIPVGWITHSGRTYMLPGMLGVPIYFRAVGWTAHSRPAYMLAGMHGVQMIIPGPRRYMRLKDIISAKIGWNTTCRHLTHMKIRLKRKILTEACGQFTRSTQEKPLERRNI